MKRLFEMVGEFLGSKKTPEQYMELGAKALAEGDYSDAEREYGKALEVAEEARAHDAVAAASTKLAIIYEETDRLAVAETHYRKAFQTEEDSEHFEEAARLLIMLGKLYHKMRRMPDAEQVLQYAMSIYQQHYTAQHPGVASAAITLAECYLDRKSYAEAEKLLLRAIAIDERDKGSSHPVVAASNHKLALCLAEQNRAAEAETAFRQAADAFEKNKATLDKPTAHQACACYHDFGRFYLKSGKTNQAKPVLLKGMELAEQYPGYLDEADLAEKSMAAP
jgi:tetratricopeptide (TPR) repeat protein